MLRGIRQMMSIHSTIGAVLCIAVLYFYPLNRRSMAQITNDLDALKAKPAGVTPAAS